MKLMTILLTVFSLSFSSFYVSYDLMANLEVSVESISVDEDYDSGALAVGYNHDLGGPWSLGASLDVLKMEGDGSDDGDGFLNLYGRYNHTLSDKMSLWGSLGYNLPQGDIDSADAGLSYGLGFSMSNGVGISYVFHNISETADGITADGIVSRFTVSYSF
tara:strand:- start:37 stop:519 length:483 start_codon:yes stop_codon:yes gene_type:complete